MPKCQPGDLAIVISCPACPRNVGRFVEVLHLSTPEWSSANGWTRDIPPDSTMWVVRAQQGAPLDALYWNPFFGGVAAPLDSLEASIDDRLLQPIRPPGKTQDTPTSLSDCQPRWVVAPDNELAEVTT